MVGAHAARPVRCACFVLLVALLATVAPGTSPALAGTSQPPSRNSPARDRGSSNAPGKASGEEYSRAELRAIVREAAEDAGISPDLLAALAACESDWDPTSKSAAVGDAEGERYTGLFQFLPSTFYRAGGKDIFDPREQATIAAELIADGEGAIWGACWSAIAGEDDS